MSRARTARIHAVLTPRTTSPLVDTLAERLPPELPPYFVTGSTDDEAGIMTTLGARPGRGSLAHELVTTPGLIAVVDGVVAGVLAGIVGLQVGFGSGPSLAGAVIAGLATTGTLELVHYRLVVRPRRTAARFPDRR